MASIYLTKRERIDAIKSRFHRTLGETIGDEELCVLLAEIIREKKKLLIKKVVYDWKELSSLISFIQSPPPDAVVDIPKRPKKSPKTMQERYPNEVDGGPLP